MDRIRLLVAGFSLPVILKLNVSVAARLAHMVERQSAVREVEGSTPDWTNTQGFKITEENVLPL